MDCSNFLDSYSDFRDGLITDPRMLRLMRQHLGDCLPCARYDASVRHGIGALGEVEFSPDFRERLRQRIAATAGRPVTAAEPRATSIAAGLMLAAAVALLVYERTSGGEAAQVPVATVASVAPAAASSPIVDSSLLRRAVAARPMPVVVVNAGVPFVVFTDLPASPFRNAGSPEFPVQSDIPPRSWDNLPR
jgi:hypothetical protein